MSTMRKLKKSFTAARQNVMEKTHSRENTQETQVLKDFERRIEDQTFYLRKICKNIKKETTSIAVSVEDGNALADTFIDYGVKMRDQNDLEILTGVLSKVGEFQVGLEDLRAKLNTSLINDVSDPLHTMVKTELKAAKEEKARYDKVRVQYDATIADLHSLKKSKVKANKVQEAEQECERQKMLFDAIENETLVLMRETSDVSEFETVEKLCDYLEAYHKFFQKGFRWLNQMLPDIYEYRLYVERRKSELENSKVRASMMSSQPIVGSISPNRIFGEDLMTIVKRDKTPVPKFITEAFTYIREKALDEEGIFRVSGNKREVMEMKGKIDQALTPGMFSEVMDTSIVASLIKMFLRELPDPLLTYDRYKSFLATVEMDDQDKRVAQIASIVATLPAANYELLRQLLELCTEIAAHKSTKMGAANLATVLAPNILVTSAEDVQVDDVAIGNIVITTMIQHVDKVFPANVNKTFDWVRDQGGSAPPLKKEGSGGERGGGVGPVTSPVGPVSSPVGPTPDGEKSRVGFVPVAGVRIIGGGGGGGGGSPADVPSRPRRPTIPTHPIPISPPRNASAFSLHTPPESSSPSHSASPPSSIPPPLTRTVSPPPPLVRSISPPPPLTRTISPPPPLVRTISPPGPLVTPPQPPPPSPQHQAFYQLGGYPPPVPSRNGNT